MRTVECDAVPAAADVTATDNCDASSSSDSGRDDHSG